MALIEERYPALGELIELWRNRQREACPLLSSLLETEDFAALANITVTLTAAGVGDQLLIARSGEAVDALYGVRLTGSSAARLSPERDDAEREACSAISTGRPLLIEDELRGLECRRRIARLYLPLSNIDGSVDGVLCGVVPVG